jgi:hypothetical protein
MTANKKIYSSSNTRTNLSTVYLGRFTPNFYIILMSLYLSSFSPSFVLLSPASSPLHSITLQSTVRIDNSSALTTENENCNLPPYEDKTIVRSETGRVLKKLDCGGNNNN